LQNEYAKQNNQAIYALIADVTIAAASVGIAYLFAETAIIGEGLLNAIGYSIAAAGSLPAIVIGTALSVEGAALGPLFAVSIFSSYFLACKFIDALNPQIQREQADVINASVLADRTVVTENMAQTIEYLRLVLP
jgi:hypothetical protein